jgi:Mn-dependent DtxR family transcriptional regulator
MGTKTPNWTKLELHIYILLLCANADSEETEEEINFIKSKSDPETFERMYKEFKDDSESRTLKKIQENIERHDYSTMELIEFRKEVHQIFTSDGKFHRMEKNLDRILDNILY